jgi:hypothetical protein
MTYLILVGFVIAIAIAWYLASLRRKRLRAWAASSGLTFDPRPDRDFDDRYPEFGCLRIGHSRYAYNVAEGKRQGRAVVAFDYRYVTGAGKSRHVHHLSGILLGSDVPLKPLRIRPEHFFDKIGEFFGLDDIDFESSEFSRSFHVKSPDKRWAFDVLHQRTMEFLLGAPRFSIQFSDDCVLVWRGRIFSPETFDEAIGVGEGILDRIPGYVTREEGER